MCILKDDVEGYMLFVPLFALTLVYEYAEVITADTTH